MFKNFEEVVWKSKQINNVVSKSTLLKENESIDFYKEMNSRDPNTRFVFVVRDPVHSMSSYQTLSVSSTKAKTGIDPRTIKGWQTANDEFRVDECNRMIDFYEALPDTRKIVVTYDQFVDDIKETTKKILSFLDVDIDDEYETYLDSLNSAQSSRAKGYENIPHRIHGLDRYEQFVKHANAEYLADEVRTGVG